MMWGFYVLLALGIVAVVLACVLSTKTPTVVVPTPSPVVTPTATATPSATPAIVKVVYDTFTEAGSGATPLTGHVSDLGNAWQDIGLLPLISSSVMNGLGYATNDTANPGPQLQVTSNKIATVNYNPSTDTLSFSVTFTMPGTAVEITYLAFGFTNALGDGIAFTFEQNTTGTSHALTADNILGFTPSGVIQTVSNPGLAPTDPTALTITGTLAPDGSVNITFNSGDLTIAILPGVVVNPPNVALYDTFSMSFYKSSGTLNQFAHVDTVDVSKL